MSAKHPDPSDNNNSSSGSSNSTIFYLAYGSNMNDAVLRGRRQINPIRSFPCRVPGWTLVFNTPGLPYREPSFASILPSEQVYTRSGKVEELHGVVHEITQEEYHRIKVTEGGGGHEGLGYLCRTVSCVCYEPNDPDKVVMTVDARTLFHALDQSLHPSKAHSSTRYKNLLIEGARHYGVAKHYQEYLQSLPHYDTNLMGSNHKLGNFLFLFTAVPFVLPFFAVMIFSNLTKRQTPRIFYLYFNYVAKLMWLLHDYFFEVIFGSGAQIMPHSDPVGLVSDIQPISGASPTDADEDKKTK